jgi:hypothetical protein
VQIGKEHPADYHKPRSDRANYPAHQDHHFRQFSGCENAAINRGAAPQSLHKEEQHRALSQINKKLSRTSGVSGASLNNDSNLISVDLPIVLKPDVPLPLEEHLPLSKF